MSNYFWYDAYTDIVKIVNGPQGTLETGDARWCAVAGCPMLISGVVDYVIGNYW